MNKVLTQFKREFWESRASLVRTPMYLALVLVALMLIGLATSGNNLGGLVQGASSNPQHGEAMTISLVFNDKETVIDSDIQALLTSGQLFRAHPKLLGATLAGMGTIFMLVFLLVQPSYLLSALYADRRDQSVLFWKSLPVSETQNVLTKLATAVLAAPFGYMLSALAAGLVYLVILLGYAGLFLGMQLPGLGQMLSALVDASASLVVGWLVLALWAMPLVCWLLFCSALAKKAPFLLSVGIPLALGVLEVWVLGSRAFATVVADQLKGAVGGFGSVIVNSEQMGLYIGQTLTAPAVWIGLALSAGLVIGSIALRNYRYEI